MAAAAMHGPWKREGGDPHPKRVHAPVEAMLGP